MLFWVCSSFCIFHALWALIDCFTTQRAAIGYRLILSAGNSNHPESHVLAFGPFGLVTLNSWQPRGASPTGVPAWPSVDGKTVKETYTENEGGSCCDAPCPPRARPGQPLSAPAWAEQLQDTWGIAGVQRWDPMYRGCRNLGSVFVAGPWENCPWILEIPVKKLGINEHYISVDSRLFLQKNG